MENIFFNDDVLTAEKKIISSLGIPSLLLMENAGANSAKYIISNFKEDLRSGTVIISGKGNNAGDGFVIARHLTANNFYVKLLMLYPEGELSGDALINFRILENSKDGYLEIINAKDHNNVKKEIDKGCKIIIDSVFGIGFRGEPDLRMRKIIETVNNSDKTVIAVDIPSCLTDYEQQLLFYLNY